MPFGTVKTSVTPIFVVSSCYQNETLVCRLQWSVLRTIFQVFLAQLLLSIPTLPNFRLDEGQTANDKKAWESQKAEMTQRIAELTALLDSTQDELAGLKEIHDGDWYIG